MILYRYDSLIMIILTVFIVVKPKVSLLLYVLLSNNEHLKIT